MPNCSSCGSPISEGQGSSCSMCYGDMWHGSDGYYLEWVERQNYEEECRKEAQREYDATHAEQTRKIQETEAQCTE